MNIKEKYITKQRDNNHICERPDFPRIIKIDICNTCNYSCLFCPQAIQTGRVGNIDINLCDRIIREAYVAGAREICLSSTGEPLLNNHLEHYISLAKEIGYEYVFFNTNGFLMDEQRGEQILRAGADSIKFSINAGTTDSYRMVHGVDAFERVMENLYLLLESRKRLESSCKVYVSYVTVKQTQQEVPLLQKQLEAMGIDGFMAMGANSRGGGISREVFARINPGIDEFSYQYPCSQLFTNMYITSEGYVNICAQDFENLTVVADLNCTDVMSAWHSDNFVAFRRRYLNQDFEGTLCKNCLYGEVEEVYPLDGSKLHIGASDKKIESIIERIREMENLNE